jgi:hypothetical protein
MMFLADFWFCIESGSFITGAMDDSSCVMNASRRLQNSSNATTLNQYWQAEERVDTHLSAIALGDVVTSGTYVTKQKSFIVHPMSPKLTALLNKQRSTHYRTQRKI